MLKDTSYQDKFAMVAPWMASIIDQVKRDLKNEHLRQDIAFVKRYFPGKNPAKLTAEELAPAYVEFLQQGEKREEVGEYIAHRWLLKHTDLYDFFERALAELYPDFTELSLIEQPIAQQLMDRSVAEFGALSTYLFCVFNSVVFPEEVYTLLSRKAEEEKQTRTDQEEQHKQQISVEEMKRRYEEQIARLTDKYEKKLSGLQKKYQKDVNDLKIQVGSLQKKLRAV